MPQSWLRYAGLVSRQFEVQLAAGDPVAVRFHRFLELQATSAADHPPLNELKVKVWIGRNGEIVHLDFASLGNAQADDDLRRLLNREPASEPPPADMRQPLILSIALQVRV